MKVQVSGRAVEDIARLRAWLEGKNPEAAKRAVEAIVDGLRSLEYFPLRGVAWRRGGRQLPIRFGRDGYIVRYVITGDVVVVARVFHARERR